jgi:hypothetical protein
MNVVTVHTHVEGPERAIEQVKERFPSVNALVVEVAVAYVASCLSWMGASSLRQPHPVHAVAVDQMVSNFAVVLRHVGEAHGVDVDTIEKLYDAAHKALCAHVAEVKAQRDQGVNDPLQMINPLEVVES